MSSLPPLEILAIGGGSASEGFVLPLREHLQGFLKRPVRIGRTVDVPRLDHGRKVSSVSLIDALMDRSQSRGLSEPAWVLGVTGYELTAPNRTCIFGEATLGGGWAVVSTARLGGRVSDRALVLARLQKEALHELGHLAGLGHCTRPRCIMRVSSSLTEIDRKRFSFCLECNERFFAG